MNGGTEMDVREKLVEMLGNIYFLMIDGSDTIGEYTIPHKFKEKIADHLISNGVTVQEWVSVDDRLPEIPEGWAETPEPVLYMMKNTKTIYAGYYGEGGVWKDKYFRQYADSRNGVDVDDVLCWMYQHDLPQPPKGE